MLSPNDDLFSRATVDHSLEADKLLRTLSHAAALKLPVEQRLRWFYLAQVWHPELRRVTADIQELMNPNNDVRIVSLIGMTGIGKTTFANNLVAGLIEKYAKEQVPSDVPLIYVRAPANGEKSLSWKVLYTRMLTAGAEVLVARKKAAKKLERANDRVVAPDDINTLAGMREYLEKMFVNRNVRVVVIDEALHLLRFDKFEAVMDTLKSLADIHNTKLLLIGAYDIADLMTAYGQVARRGEIVHYRRYMCGPIPSKDDPMSGDQQAFREILQKLNLIWPSVNRPILEPHWHLLMACSLGSAGMLKSALVRLACLQLETKNEQLTKAAPD